jgi:hypothetical protein
MDFRKEIDALRERLQAKLPFMGFHSPTEVEQLKAIFLTYDKVIRHNFIMWMMLVKACCKSDKAKAVCDDNLKCEIGENHPQMLLDFVFPLLKPERMGGQASERAIRLALYKAHAIEQDFSCIRLACEEAVTGLIVMATLENLSLAFIPWMKKQANALELQNLKYLEVHGEEDVKHAEAFLEALEAEAKLGEVDEQRCKETLNNMRKFLDQIFDIKK